MTKQDIPDRLLDKQQTAQLLGCSVQHLLKIEAHLIAAGRLKPIRVGGKIKYRLGAILGELVRCETTGDAFYTPIEAPEGFIRSGIRPAAG